MCNRVYRRHDVWPCKALSRVHRFACKHPSQWPVWPHRSAASFSRIKSWPGSQRSTEEKSCSTTCRGQAGVNVLANLVQLWQGRGEGKVGRGCMPSDYSQGVFRHGSGMHATVPMDRAASPHTHQLATRVLGLHQGQGAGQGHRLRLVQDAWQRGGEGGEEERLWRAHRGCSEAQQCRGRACLQV